MIVVTFDILVVVGILLLNCSSLSSFRAHVSSLTRLGLTLGSLQLNKVQLFPLVSFRFSVLTVFSTTMSLVTRSFLDALYICRFPYPLYYCFAFYRCISIRFVFSLYYWFALYRFISIRFVCPLYYWFVYVLQDCTSMNGSSDSLSTGSTTGSSANELPSQSEFIWSDGCKTPDYNGTTPNRREMGI